MKLFLFVACTIYSCTSFTAQDLERVDLDKNFISKLIYSFKTNSCLLLPENMIKYTFILFTIKCNLVYIPNNKQIKNLVINYPAFTHFQSLCTCGNLRALL